MPTELKPAAPVAEKSGFLSEQAIAKGAQDTGALNKSAVQVLLDELPADVRKLTEEKLAAGLPLRDAIECSRAQIAHDAAIAAPEKETTAKAK